ncbi:MAG: leucyl aminopeptidase [Patescibacteria group bacterium]
MKFQAKATEVTKIEADILAVFALPGKERDRRFILTEEAKKVDRALSGMLTEVATTEEFEAKPAKLLLIHTHSKLPAKRVLLVGLGEPSKLAMFDWQTTTARIGRECKAVKAKRLAVAIPEEVLSALGTPEAAQGLVVGVALGTYVFLKHKAEAEQKKEKPLEEVYLLTAAGKLNSVSAGLELGQVVSRAVAFSRDLVNEPPSTTTPSYLGEVARAVSQGSRVISCEVLGPEQMKKLGMEAILGIARGSDEEPRFIKLAYKGGGRKTVCLVGKGITFDTGGLSLKPSEGMQTMKLDMAGAAAILAIFQALRELKPKLNVVGLIAATENMPGGRAIKPGDIVRALNGKTIEILNTDAEGRVILSDALSYAAERVKPDVLIDLATLTGACMVALGEEIAGIFGTDVKLVGQLKEAARASGERLWELPLAADYQETLKSTVADLKNITGSKYGGAITAALFLKEFVPEGIPWVHLDIAGPAFAEKDAPLTPKGGTGFGVRTILHYLLS